jgi:hypothetical protein
MKSDYKPSAHLVGDDPAHEVSLKPLLACIAAAILVVVMLNVFFPEPVSVSCDRPAAVQK